MVKGGDSQSKGYEFESLHRIYWMDIFAHLFVLRIVMFVWKDEINEKETGVGSFLKK